MLKFIASLALLTLSFFPPSNAQTDYSDFSKQSGRLQALVKNYPQLVSLRALTKTAGGRELWLLTIGTGERDSKPGIFVAGGVEGNHLLGMELAIGFAESLLARSQSDSIKSVLQKTTFYVAPDMSPDAMEQYFSKIKYERQANASATDDDRDGQTNEDGYDDLDGNGKITQIRVESPIGDYKLHPDDPRVMIRADLSKGEKGAYQLLTEGIDNDKDGAYNEDGEGGAWFNRNFTYKYPVFTAGAGEFPISEPETKAIADFLFDRFNIYAVVSFGSNNNLSLPMIYNSQIATQRIVSGWQLADVTIDSMVSDFYLKAVPGMKDAPKETAAGGDFYSWAYFHYGRYSFGTPGWFVPKTKADSTRHEKEFTVDDPVANYLRWTSQQGLPDNFNAWKTVTDPDFPGRKVEVGGIDPFVLITPPYKMVADLVRQHSEFLIGLANMQPTIDIINVKTEKVGNGLTRITFDVINKGALASHSKIGERSDWVKRIVIKVNNDSKQTIISGRRIQTLGSLNGFGSQTLTWLIRGTGRLTIEAGSPTTGNKSIEVTL